MVDRRLPRRLPVSSGVLRQLFRGLAARSAGSSFPLTVRQVMAVENQEFKDKVVVITGAAGIFGRWIAAYFAREGAKLCLSDVRPDQLKASAAELGLDSSRIMTHVTELMDE